MSLGDSSDAHTATAEPAPQEAPTPASSFDDLVVRQELRRAIAAVGYTTPTPVQARAIPLLRQGGDALVQAQTGTGKTAAFCIPLLDRLLSNPRPRPSQPYPPPYALVLCPTRELAAQVAAEAARLAKGTPLQIAVVYGGTGMKEQQRALKKGVDLLVGTPGRTLDLFEQGYLKLAEVRVVVLDEADRLLDLGFAPQVTRLVRKTSPERQTVLCSATLGPEVTYLARSLCRREPDRLEIEPERVTVDLIDQYFYEALDEEKVEALLELTDMDPESPIYRAERVLVFCRTQIGVERLARNLWRKGASVDYLHGGLSQTTREAVLQRFKDKHIRFLVTTNVSARGIDIEDLEAVVSYDIPEEVATYTHRIGRTARAGKRGAAVLLVGEWDHELFAPIRETMGGRLQQRVLRRYR